ncbi:MAG: hypothetical protein KatS3mg004_0185 [Bryobacteraceae bacterium]|nr:MAG: hypothetical protein KatS3mg004_0185 [Bryobacteraceae bacterium]
MPEVVLSDQLGCAETLEEVFSAELEAGEKKLARSEESEQSRQAAPASKPAARIRVYGFD